MKTIQSINKKWELKIAQMIKKADFKYDVLLQNRKRTIEKVWDYEVEKIEKKKRSYIKKKEEEYRRKCANEIREFEGKPKRVYKTAGPKINPLEFAMAIAQENSKLRDTNEHGDGRCISCNKRCSWGELAGGHRFSRRFQNMCLEEENINAQCHTCNFTTGPRGDTVAKVRTNDEYDKNLDIKYGEGTAKRLAEKVYEYTHGNYKKYDLTEKIPELIKKNEELWATKDFYAPKKKRRSIRDEYAKRH